MKRKPMLSMVLGMALLMGATLQAGAELFSANLWSPGKSPEWNPESWRDTIRVNAKTAGIWETSAWSDLNVAGIAAGGSATISGSEGSTATFKIVQKRNQSPYNWDKLRDGTTDPAINPVYMANGNASLLDAKLVGTEVSSGSTVDPTYNAVIEVSGLNMASYEVVIYLSMNAAQFGSGGNAGRGFINFNDTGLTEWKVPSGQPPTTLTQVVDSGDTGNYILYSGVTGPSFTVRAYGHGFNHGGIAGFQIRAGESAGPGPVDAGTSTVVAAHDTVFSDGLSTTTVTVTLRDADGRVIADEDVALADSEAVAQIDAPTTAATNASGQATFTVRSTTPGTAEFVATVVSADNLVLTQSAAVEFVEPAVDDSFSVNLYNYGRQNAGDVWLQESARQTVRLEPGDSAGAEGFTTAGWQNVFGSLGTTPITSTQGSSATFRLVRQRSSSPYYWTTTRNAATHQIPNAKMLDGKSHGTFDPGDESLHSIFEVTDIPFAAYDIAIYFGINQAQSGNGRGSIRINGGVERRFTMLTTEPDGTLVEITDQDTPGNYLVVRGLSGPTLQVEIRGDGFNHLGPSGFQIAQADRARPPLEITGFELDPVTQQVTLTWRSFPGDLYGVYWSGDFEEFAPSINPVVPAHAADEVTTHGPFTTPLPDASRAMFRIGPADLHPPTLERVWGNNSTISLTFSEPMDRTLAADPANYSVVRDGGGGGEVEVTFAGFHPGRETIVLTTGQPLDLDATYTVTLNNLTDLAGWPLGDDTTATFRTWDDNPDGVRVFILSGQSNMVGRGSLENGHGGVSGAIGSLRYQAVNDTANYGHLLVNPAEPAASAWITRSDVKLWWNRADIGGPANILKGNLHPTLNPNSFGPEYGFGWAVGAQSAEPVLLIKSCWGGKSLFVDFRPPSAAAARGGDVGPYYLELIQHVRQVLDNLGTQFPEFAGMGYQIAGFGWHQGWNDSMHAFPASEYEANLADFIRDLRAEFGRPDLPVSIGATGHGGFSQPAPRATLVAAQLAVADPELHPEFAGTVFTADTRPFWRDASVSPANDGSHWNNNGETLFLIGDSMGQGMVDLIAP